MILKEHVARFMRAALDKAREGVRRGQTPFGACVVRHGKVIACEHNAVWKQTDCTAHAEIQAIRKACKRLKTIDLSDCEIFSTCEPCPMCFSACHWARIPKIYYGAGIRDAKRFGFNELEISNKQMRREGNSSMKIKGGLISKECIALFKEWEKRKGTSY